MFSHGHARPGDTGGPAEARGSAAERSGAFPLVDLDVDLRSHELLRRAHILDALGPAWDPIAVLREEEAAYDLLYSRLGPEQQRVYDELVSAGVLPRGRGGHAAA
ncbi:DUF6400 family protein [Streptomyces bobili]|uniref:DUF6400 family protein n=1 Tax=Streptomyces bobili TaxID=67280 RepID=UPI0036FAB60D